MPDHFYITTPIYYVNDKPHIGHAYTTVLADVLARYHRLRGEPTYFLTGTDEHGQKVAQAAQQHGITPQQQCDTTVQRFQELWKKLDITYDDFIRTTETRHATVVQGILQDLYNRGEIYKADYRGWYCVPCERFFTTKDLTAQQCPDCGRPVDEIVEPNYFFRMGAYQEWLIQYIQEHPDFIQPPHRRNETLGFLRQPLGDLCISRPKSRLSWGIELPFDAAYVCYVWFDALINYISAIGYGADPKRFQSWWPASFHLIGKDILTTHSVYWPTMLKAIGISLPRTIFAHGWWLVGRNKMGKSLGNVVDPMTLIDRYGVDSFRYFLMAEMMPGHDASFTEEAFIERYNTDLADNLGNMVSRAIKLIVRNCDAAVPAPGEETPVEQELRQASTTAVQAMTDAFAAMKLSQGLDAAMSAVRTCNQYFERTAPWHLARDRQHQRLNTVLYSAAESLRVISALLYPFIPGKMTIMRRALGVGDDALAPKPSEWLQWGVLTPGSRVQDIVSLFPRILPPAPSAVVEASSTKSNPVAEETKPAGLVTIDEVGKLALRTARIVAAETIPKTSRLLRLQIELGAEKRQIVAGIAESYKPEELVGKLIVIVANLVPATIRGIESHGMLLAAKAEGRYRLVTVDGDCPTGASVG